MRRAMVLFAAALLLVSVVGSVPASAEPSDPFRGAWKAIDFDGSAMTLAISGGGSTRHVSLFDVSCGGCDPSGYPTVGVGFGQVVGGTLEATITWYGRPGYGFEGFETLFTLEGDGSLTQTVPDCPECLPQPWYRAGR
jgi:hypothetical protein